MGELPNVCSRIVLKCLNLARTGRQDNLWSVKHKFTCSYSVTNTSAFQSLTSLSRAIAGSIITLKKNCGRMQIGSTAFDSDVSADLRTNPCVSWSWACGRATHGLLTEVGTGVPWVSCPDPPVWHTIQGDGAPERQHCACCACVA